MSCPASYGAAHVPGTTSETFDLAGDVLSRTGPDGGSGGAAGISAVGSPAVYSGYVGANTASLADSPNRAGDLMALAVINSTWADSVTSVSGGGVSSWASAGAPFFDGADGEIMQISVRHRRRDRPGERHGALERHDKRCRPRPGGVQRRHRGHLGLGHRRQRRQPVPLADCRGQRGALLRCRHGLGNGAAGSTTGVAYDVPNNGFLMAWDTDTTGTLAPGGTGAGSVAALFAASGGSAPASGTTTYQYTDPAHPWLPTITTDPDGQVTTVAYNAAGQVVSSTVSFGSYTATTLSAYTASGLAYCTVSPLEAAAGVTCPPSPPSPPAPPANLTSSFYNPSGQLVQTTGPPGPPRYMPTTAPATSTARSAPGLQRRGR